VEIAGQRQSSILRHVLDARERFEGTEEDRSCFTLALTRNVQAVMVAVDEVNIGVAGRSEKDRSAGGVASGGVGGGVVLAEVSFDFDDPGGEAKFSGVADEDFAEKFASYAAGVAGEEGAGEREDGCGCGLRDFTIYRVGHLVQAVLVRATSSKLWVDQ